MAATAMSASAQAAATLCHGLPAPQGAPRRGPAAMASFSGLRSAGRPAQALAAAPAPAAGRRSRRSVVCEATETATTVGPVTDDTFKSLVLDSDVPVVVDFWAPWCGPCRMIEPLVNEIAAQYGAKVKVLKLNTDESPATATEYGIRSIPTVMVFKRGKKVDTIIGAVPKSTLTSTIDKYL